MNSIPVVSYSSLDTYAKCPYCYYLKYIVKESQETSDFTGTVPGNTCHKLAEQFFEYKNLAGEVDWSIFDNNFESVFNKYVNGPNVFLGPEAFAKNVDDARTKIKSYRDNLISMLKSYNMVKPVTISEFRFGSHKSPIHLTDKLLFCGGPDLFSADSMEAPGVLVDFKASDSQFHINDKQLFLYTIALEQELKVKVSMAGFFLFKSGEAVWRVVSKDRLDETIAWAEDIVDSIQKEKFEPCPSSASCRLCPFKKVCKHSSYIERKQSSILSILELKSSSIDFEIPETPDL